jgi:membrane-associated phospholipid phosphatase
MKRLTIVLLFIGRLVFAQKSKENFTDRIQPSVFSLSMIMMHDVVNPPAAARFYAYGMLGAYDIVSQNKESFQSPTKIIRSYKTATISISKDKYNYQVAALWSIIKTGELILPSGYRMEEEEKKMLEWFKKLKLSPEIINNSIKVAEEVSSHVITFSRTDNYSKLSTLIRYTPVSGEGFWYPTPPAYMEAVEPNWRIIRPLLIDSCNQFVPVRPTEFSRETDSKFYALAKEVYDVSKKMTPEQLTIAAFWDCNPFVLATAGHMSLGFKKISPGGHWMNIAAVACRKARLDFDKSIQVQALTAFTLMDAFISCWDEKYRSNRIRPETYINRYIDAKWTPLLQTPPFPEYTSGHSVISTASAEVLSYLLGENFAYTDDTEVMFELNPRNFKSFRAAAAEAAVSRLYGGIHYRDAIESGQEQGRRIGKGIIKVLQTAGIPAYQ